MLTTVPNTRTDYRTRIIGLVLLTILILPLDTEGRFVRMSSFTILIVGALIGLKFCSNLLKTMKRERDIRRKEKDFEGIFGKTAPSDQHEALSIQTEVRSKLKTMLADCMLIENRKRKLLFDHAVNPEAIDSICQESWIKQKALRRAFELAKFYGLDNKTSLNEEGS